MKKLGVGVQTSKTWFDEANPAESIRRAMVDAAHEIGVRAPIYITAGWSDEDAK